MLFKNTPYLNIFFWEKTLFWFICGIINVEIKNMLVFLLRKDRHKNLLFLFFFAEESIKENLTTLSL